MEIAGRKKYGPWPSVGAVPNGGPLRYSAIAHSCMMVSFYEPPVVYPAAHRIHAAFLACQVPTSGRHRTVAKTDSRGWTPCSGRPLRRPHLGPFFLRAEVHSRRCRHSEFVAAKRHFESEATCELRPANCGAVRPIHRIVDNVAISLYNITTYSYSMRLAEKGDFIDEF